MGFNSGFKGLSLKLLTAQLLLVDSSVSGLNRMCEVWHDFVYTSTYYRLIQLKIVIFP